MIHRIFLLLYIIISTFANLNVNKLENSDFTDKEIRALTEFRKIIIPQLYLDHQKSDWYLIHWLRAFYLDLDKTFNHLVAANKWRKEMKIDGILNDKIMIDYKNRRMPFYNTAIDKIGRPVTTILTYEWDLRKEVTSGNSNKLSRYFGFFYESMSVRILTERNRTGNENISQFILLLDMAGYNGPQHACLGCIQFFKDLILNYVNYYTGQCSHLILVNTPRAFDRILNVIKPILRPIDKKTLHVFGHNKAEWRPLVSDLVSDTQLLRQFGGILEKKL